MFLSLITQETGIALGIVLSVGGAVIGAIVWLARKLDHIEEHLKRIDKQISDGWTVQHQKIWALQLQIDNKDVLCVPDPFAIHKGESQPPERRNQQVS